MNARNSKSFPRRGPILSAPIRADVRLTNSAGFSRRFENWESVAEWLASASFLKGTPNVTSVRIVCQQVQADAVRRPAATGPGDAA